MGLRAIARGSQRWLLSYFALYVGLGLFPVWVIPGTEKLLEPIYKVQQNAITWLAKAVLGIRITVYPGGSGDTTYNYVELLTTAVLALVVAVAWTLAVHGRPVGPRTQRAVATYVRYFVAASAISYGWIKVFPLQFPAPGPDRLIATFESTSPMGILWAFMGASTPYQMFAGFAELSAGLLLIFRRTAALGALVCAAVFTNIVMLNFSYDVPVKLYSGHLLLMSIWLAVPQFARLAGVLVLGLPTAPERAHTMPMRRPAWRWASRLVKGSLIVLVIAWPAVEGYKGLRTRGPLREVTSLHGIFRVESFSRSGITNGDNPDSVRWVRVGINDYGRIAIQRADGSSRRTVVEIDRTKRQLVIAPNESETPPRLTYSEPVPDVLILEGTFEGAATTVHLRRLPPSSSLLTSRGFHWINEFPFNR